MSEMVKDAVPDDWNMSAVPVEAALESVMELPPVADEVRLTVGRQLRLARETAGLTLADVAQALKFSARQVELLESDDYASLPGATIVRGFTRSYARLLKLDENTLLSQLDDRTPSAPTDVRPPDNMGVAESGENGRQFSALASVAIVIGLAAVLLGVWHYFSQMKPIMTPVKSEVPAAAVPVSPPVPQAAVAEPVVAVAANLAPEPASATPTLKFTLDDRAWLEVSDARKQVLHTGESPAGSVVTLSGQPPFDIVVGNAGRVRLTYGERVIDLAPHTRAEVARLKLE